MFRQLKPPSALRPLPVSGGPAVAVPGPRGRRRVGSRARGFGPLWPPASPLSPEPFGACFRHDSNLVNLG
jgi:hypothetical protein